MSDVKTQAFKKASKQALQDPKLQASLKRVMHHFDEARQDAIEEITPQRWEELRQQGREIKQHTLDNLDYYLEMLSERVSQAGGVVHFARDSQEATSIVAELVRSRGVKTVVKSKSMVSEEINLNHVLADIGVEALETDLGEYIIQLAEETPFHIIAPAMHKTKEDVSDLFSKKLGTPHIEQIEELAAVARQSLREKFLKAEMGITGANFLVAETGTLVIVTNEGNGRLCTSAPRIHVAISGMEKLVPSLEDMAVFLRLLPRAATGQRITSYVSFINGPRRSQDEDGPEEFHLIITDNGRSRLLRDPELREALYCIRCGACLNICPIYRNVGGHAYGWVYPGPIGAVVSPMMVGLNKAKDLPNASSLCGACREVCPIKINIPHMLLNLRSKLMESPEPQERKRSLEERIFAWAFLTLMRSPRMLALGHALGRILQRPFLRNGRISRIPFPPFSVWTRSRDLPPLAKKSFHQIWEEELS